MQIEFEIDQQRLTRTSDAYLIEGSKNFVECVFSFSSDWNELDKWALFKRANNTYEIFIENNKCLVPIQCTSAEGEFTISVVGRKNAESVTGTASDKLLTVRGSEFVGGMGEEGRLTETYLVEVLAEVKALHEKTTTSENNAAQSAKESADSAAAALRSETNAKVSENAAKASENAATLSETNAKTSEKNAKTSETNAKSSATNSEASARNAAASESNAGDSATAAALSAKNAASSEKAAAGSENAAATSLAETQKKAQEAAGSAALAQKWAAGENPDGEHLSARQYAEQAGASEAAAKTSETNAKNSENAAKASETAAAKSETNAAASAETARTLIDDAFLMQLGLSVVEGKICITYDKEA